MLFDFSALRETLLLLFDLSDAEDFRGTQYLITFAKGVVEVIVLKEKVFIIKCEDSSF